jgi:diguanylate cyclase (GGDEF)-like protein/PAS domain S-box-containing protein
MTESRAAEAALRERQERLLLALAASGMETWDWDPRTGEVTWPETTEELIGAVPSTGCQTFDAFLASVHPDDRAHVSAKVDQALTGRGDYDPEYRKFQKDGSVQWYLSRGRVEWDSENQPIRMRGVIMDITARKETEAALQASEARFRGLVQHAADLISVMTADGTVLYQSPALERLLGFRPDDRLGSNGLARVNPEDLPRVHQALASIATSPGAMTTVALRAQHRDGSWRWLEATATNLINEPSIGGIVVNSRDITDQRVAVEELRFRGELLDQAIVAVIAVDTAGRVTHWNRHAEALYGWSRDEAIGRQVADLLVGPSDRTIAAQIRKQLQAGESWEGEFSCPRRDGSSVVVHVVDSPIRDEMGKVIGTVGISVDISERKHLEARLAHLATHDALTGLPNRVLFADRLDHALRVASRRGEPVAVVMLDLDRFKLVNDDLGHAAGDQLLVAVGHRLATCVREVDTLARFGGDEFVLLLEGATPEHARNVAERILARLAEPLMIADREVVVSTSMGITFSSPERGDARELLRAADVALYRAKRAGRSQFIIFDPSEPDTTAGWLALEADLRRAIRNGELHLAYQPIIDLTRNQVVSVEALVRWQHPTRGAVPPSTFVPLAEETGLITELTAWVINEACEQLALWHSRLDPEMVPMVNVNVTSRDLRDPELVGHITRVLHETGVPSRCLRLEITEHVLVEEVRAATGTLERLRALGVGLAIDDFGAGASSLASLRAVNAEVLKLDRSFVRGMTDSGDDRIVVAAIVAMAHALGILVTAEGIETLEQCELARQSGCDRGQGFWFARPLPPADVIAFLHRSDYQMQLTRT